MSKSGLCRFGANPKMLSFVSSALPTLHERIF